MVARAAQKPRSWALAHPEACLSSVQAAWLEQAILRLEADEPLPYVLGEWEFFGLSYAVSPAALIPRPESELLVDHALAWCRQRSSQQAEVLRIADIGTGTGCIAISLAVNLPQVFLVGGDISEAALLLAQHNARLHQVSHHIALVQADLLTPFALQSFHLVCANLPYIPSLALRHLAVYEKEPVVALDGGPDGLDFIRRIILQAPACLASGGLLLAEIEANQGQTVQEFAQKVIRNAQVNVYKDYSGKDRLLKVQFPG